MKGRPNRVELCEATRQPDDVKRAAPFCLALITAPDLKTGRKLAELALQARLAACANIVPKIESHYWWRGRIESGNEVLMVLKTRRARLKALEALVLEHHPYDTPELITVSLQDGTAAYLRWLGSECPPD